MCENILNAFVLLISPLITIYLCILFHLYFLKHLGSLYGVSIDRAHFHFIITS